LRSHGNDGNRRNEGQQHRDIRKALIPERSNVRVGASDKTLQVQNVHAPLTVTVAERGDGHLWENFRFVMKRKFRELVAIEK
jgi:hypothetical protein